MAGIDVNAKRTLAVLDIVSGTSSPKNMEERAEALLQLTNIIRLFTIKERLGSDWGKYIYDATVNALGEDSEEKLRAKRKELLGQLASLDSKELGRTAPSLRRELIGQRIFDYEPGAREAFKQFLLNLLDSEGLKTIKLSTHSPSPVSVLFSEKDATLLAFDNLYIDPQTVRMFDSKKNATDFVIRLAVALLYCRRKNLASPADVAKDSLASEYSRTLYKLWLKSLAEENNENMRIGEQLRDHDIPGAAERLMGNDAFYMTMKNMASALLVEFGPARLNLASFLGTAAFAFDEYGKDRISELVSRNRRASALCLSGTASLFDYLVKNFSLDDAYLERDFSLASMGENGWIERLPLRINAECTADYENPKEKTTVFVGLKKFVITFSSGEFIELTKAEDSFITDPVHHTCIYSVTTMLYPESGMMQGTFYAMPELDALLIELRRYGKVDEKAINRANFIFARGMRGKQPFAYFEKNGNAGVVGSFTDVMIAKPERGGRK
ncbi:hypothetical protein H0O02_01725 [Candidatus Micrarchaeota archaeon]|nr:hypothetical protein [Candidatus Micrarchaeota archaeon]